MTCVVINELKHLCHCRGIMPNKMPVFARLRAKAAAKARKASCASCFSAPRTKDQVNCQRSRSMPLGHPCSQSIHLHDTEAVVCIALSRSKHSLSVQIQLMHCRCASLAILAHLTSSHSSIWPLNDSELADLDTNSTHRMLLTMNESISKQCSYGRRHVILVGKANAPCAITHIQCCFPVLLLMALIAIRSSHKMILNATNF